MDFTTWVRQWLATHPLTSPTDHDPHQFSAKVMERIRAVARVAPEPASPLPWVSWPRLGLALAAAAAGFLLVTGPSRHAKVQLANELIGDSALLAQFDDVDLGLPIGDNPEELAQHMKELDTMVLAQAEPSDEQWIEQTQALLDQLDDEHATPPPIHQTTTSGWMR